MMVGFIVVTMFFTLEVMNLFRPAVDAAEEFINPQATADANARREFDVFEVAENGRQSRLVSVGDET